MDGHSPEQKRSQKKPEYLLNSHTYFAENLLILDHSKKKKKQRRQQGAIRIRFIVLSVENTCSVKTSVQWHESFKVRYTS